MKFRTQFNYDRDLASVESGLACPEPSLTQQHQRDEADINYLVRQFGITGTIPQVVMPPTYEDFTESVSDYHTAMNLMRAADEAFAALPSNVRLRFGNDPGAFVAFCEEEGNLDELRKLGLALPAEVKNLTSNPIPNPPENPPAPTGENT